MSKIKSEFDNYELTTIDYTLKYYLENNELLDDDDVEWCKLVRKKIDTIMQQNTANQECANNISAH